MNLFLQFYRVGFADTVERSADYYLSQGAQSD